MTTPSDTARRHYQAGQAEADPVASVIAALNAGDAMLDAAHLEALDQFHAGGVAATLRLADLLGVGSSSHVLDAGSGLGGPARVVAERLGVQVTGVDLTPSYVELAKRLAGLTAVSDRVAYQVGDLLDLPFDAETFDAVYTQHVVMNIADRDRLYAEIRRVLKPGGVFAFHDVIAADTRQHPIYPTPWADTASSSFLLDEDETVAALQRAGLRVDAWEDVTADSIAGIAKVVDGAPRGPTLASIMGARFPAMAQNYGRNLKEGRLRVAMGRSTAF